MADSNDARDSVTGFFNRVYLDDVLPREISRAQRHGLPIGLAAVEAGVRTSTAGPLRPPGDSLLWEFGYLLQLNLRAEDIACRVGAAAFTLIMPGMAAGALARRVVELRGVIERYFAERTDRYRGWLDLTVAVASFPEDGLTAPALKQALGDALERARALAGFAASPLPTAKS